MKIEFGDSVSGLPSAPSPVRSSSAVKLFLTYQDAKPPQTMT